MLNQNLEKNIDWTFLIHKIIESQKWWVNKFVEKNVGSTFLISPDPWPNALCCSNGDKFFMTARQKLTMLFNVYRVIDPTPSFPSAHTALATGKHTLMRRENGLVHGSSVQLIEDDEWLHICICMNDYYMIFYKQLHIYILQATRISVWLCQCLNKGQMLLKARSTLSWAFQLLSFRCIWPLEIPKANDPKVLRSWNTIGAYTKSVKKNHFLNTSG